MPDLITVRQAAERLGISHVTLYRWINSTEPPPFAIKVGGRWKVAVRRLESYVNGEPS